MYEAAWTRWQSWCSNNNYSVCDPSPEIVAEFLCYLHSDVKLAPKTISVHKSVVVTFACPLKADSVNNHPLVKHTLKGIHTAKPKVKRPAIWNIDKLIDHLTNYNINSESLFQVSRHVAALLLLASGRRVHDLTLLEISPNSLVDLGSEIILWPKYGSKTDSASHRQSGWKLLENDNPKLNPILWIRTLIRLSQQRRQSQNNFKSLFITTRGKVKDASRTVIAGWISTLLREVGITSSAGSFRAAVASDSLLSRSETIDQILKRGNWKSQNTVFKHYFREISANPIPSRNPILQCFSPI